MCLYANFTLNKLVSPYQNSVMVYYSCIPVIVVKYWYNPFENLCIKNIFNQLRIDLWNISVGTINLCLLKGLYIFEF